MPQFSYTAKQGPQKIIDGKIEASNLDQAICKISQMGFTPIDVAIENITVQKPRDNKDYFWDKFINRVSLNDVAIFTRQMADLLDASFPVLKSLVIVEEQISNKKLRQVVGQVYDSVKDGGALSLSLSKHPGVFPAMYVNLVKAAEATGQLNVIFNRLADYLQKEQQSRNKVASSLAYPLLVMVLGIGTVIVLLTFVIPRLSVIFEEFNQMLPWPTLFLVNASRVFLETGWMMLIAVGVIGAYVTRWAQTPSGKFFLDERKLRMPLFGRFFLQMDIGRFARTLGTLLGNGVAIPAALNASCSTLENMLLKEEMNGVLEEVMKGSSLRSALKQCPHFPQLAVQMISVGEETGHLENGLMKVATTYERQTSETAAKIVSLLGPICLLVIVSMVGFVVIAMLLPILKMNMLV